MVQTENHSIILGFHFLRGKNNGCISFKELEFSLYEKLEMVRGESDLELAGCVCLIFFFQF